jgi:hypothetical protein
MSYKKEDLVTLKSKLEEIEKRTRKFKVNLENGVDEAQTYCVKLRNQVQLQTEILIEQVHEFNEKLIAEIDTYEKECIGLYDGRIKVKETELNEYLIELDKFSSDNSNYLSDMKIEEKQIRESIAKADSYLANFKSMETLGRLKGDEFQRQANEVHQERNKTRRDELSWLA